jgi:hypothetical protein
MTRAPGPFLLHDLTEPSRFPKARESDSTWRTKEVRHVGSDIVAP